MPEPAPLTEEWLGRYERALLGVFGRPQLVLDHGDGAWVWDVDGRRYLDLVGGIAVNALGHAHPSLLAAVGDQLVTLGHVSNFFTSTAQVELAERLVGLLDGDRGGKVFFTSSGTEANEAAFKLARRTGRSKVVAAEGGFHGRTMGALALTAKAAYREPFEPLPGEVRFVPYGEVAALDEAVDAETAAVLLEPIQGEGGVVVPPAGYLAAAREIADRHGALLWLDEVQTGVGRTGTWFAYQHEPGVRPDVVTVAKGLGGGFPVGACIGIGAAGSLLGPGQHGTTFGGNPLAAAVANTVLEVVESEDLLGRADRVGARLGDALGSVPGLGPARGRGLLLAAPTAPGAAGPVARAALDAGLIVNDVRPDALRLAPPLVLTEAQVEEAIELLTEAVRRAGAEDGALRQEGAP